MLRRPLLVLASSMAFAAPAAHATLDVGLGDQKAAVLPSSTCAATTARGARAPCRPARSTAPRCAGSSSRAGRRCAARRPGTWQADNNDTFDAGAATTTPHGGGVVEGDAVAQDAAPGRADRHVPYDDRPLHRPRDRHAADPRGRCSEATFARVASRKAYATTAGRRAVSVRIALSARAYARARKAPTRRLTLSVATTRPTKATTKADVKLARPQ